jgi:argininosuccinate lyase
MSLWQGGRFEDGPHDALWAFTVDPEDRRLLVFDVRGSMAHVAMLGEVGLVSADEARILAEGLHRIASEAADGDFAWHDSDEDVHTAVERRLGELVGDVAGKLHTGRSRNDQVALDLRLYMLDAIDGRLGQLEDMIEVLVAQARAVGDAVVPSYTHLQQAQAVPFAHHLLAHAWMLVRDVGRFRDARARIDQSPLGAGASGGSSLPLDPDVVRDRLEMSSVFDNSMDAVASRDLAAEFVWCATQAMVDLSRLSEEMILWCTTEFGWAVYADEFTTGSSAMPQKKNPDIAELARGKAATVIGDLTSLMALQKGLPLTYNRDLQEDKRLVFHADDTLAGALDALGGMLGSAVFTLPPPVSSVTALDLAEALVVRGVPFREAHHVVGRLVARLAADGRSLGDVDAGTLVEFDGRFTAQDLDRLDPSRSVGARVTPGGGSMASVAAQIESLEALIANPDGW